MQQQILVSEQYFKKRANEVAVTGIVDYIVNKMKPILNNSFGPEFIKTTNKLHFLSYGIEKFINKPPRDLILDEHKDSDGSFRNGPIVLMQKSTGEVVFMNYSLKDFIDILSQGKINDHEQIKKMIEERVAIKTTSLTVPKIYSYIFTDESLLRIGKRESTLDLDHSYTDIFENKINGELLLRKTQLNRHSYIVKSGLTLKSVDHPIVSRLLTEQEKIEQGTPLNRVGLKYGFEETAIRYKNLVNEILLLKKVENNDIRAYLELLVQLGNISDILIDNAYYLVRGFDGSDHYFNTEFLKNTPFDNKEDLLLAMEQGKFLRRVYGRDTFYTQNQIKTLNEIGHYNDYFYPFINKTGTRAMVSWDTFKYDKPNYFDTEEEATETSLTFGIGALEKCDDI